MAAKLSFFLIANEHLKVKHSQKFQVSAKYIC